MEEAAAKQEIDMDSMSKEKEQQQKLALRLLGNLKTPEAVDA